MQPNSQTANVLADNEAPEQLRSELLRMLMMLDKEDRDELLEPYFDSL